MNTIVFIIRHGEIDNPRKILYGRTIDMKLNDRGRSQIKNLAKKLVKQGEVPEKTFTSPLSRDHESAEILIKELKLKSQPIIERELIDVDIPFLAGKSMNERKKIHKSGEDEYSKKYVKLGNEFRANIVKRMKKTFDRIVKNNLGKTVAIVSHGDPIQFLLFKLSNPNKKVPSMSILVNENYPPKGRATKIVVNEKGVVTERKLI